MLPERFWNDSNLGCRERGLHFARITSCGFLLNCRVTWHPTQPPAPCHPSVTSTPSASDSYKWLETMQEHRLRFASDHVDVAQRCLAVPPQACSRRDFRVEMRLQSRAVLVKILLHLPSPIHHPRLASRTTWPQTSSQPREGFQNNLVKVVSCPTAAPMCLTVCDVATFCWPGTILLPLRPPSR